MATGEVTVNQIQAFSEAVTRISRVAGRSPSFIICGGSAPNAFATAGAKGDVVGVTIGMLKLVDGDRDMAAAVMSHELAHHTKNHLSASETRDAVIGLLTLVAGIALDTRIQRRSGVSGLGLDLAQLGGLLASRKFNRDQEREADDFGFQFMVSAGFNPIGAMRLALRMNQLWVGGAGWFFDSHPGWSERGDRFRTMITASPDAQQIIARTKEQNVVASVAIPPSSDAAEKIAIAPTYTTTDAEKSYSDGITALRSKDIPTAVRAFRAAADAGHAPAQVIIGHLHSTGRGGLPKNDAEAVRLYRLAAEQGNALGQANLGLMYASRSTRTRQSNSEPQPPRETLIETQ